MLFSLDGNLRGATHPQYDVSRDDLRFVMLQIVDDENDDAGPELIWVQNFFEELLERVPN